MKAIKNETINLSVAKDDYSVGKSHSAISEKDVIMLLFLGELYQSGCLLLQGL